MARVILQLPLPQAKPRNLPPNWIWATFLQFLQSNQQAHEQSVAQQTAATTLLLQNLSQTVSSLVNTTRPTSASQPVSFPKLNKLEDSDDADAWFSMVERVLAGHGIVESRFALAVAPQLTGKARVAYNSLPLTDSMDYRKVKAAVLRRFQISAETYHERFHAVQLVDSESYLDLVARLNDLFTKWMDRAQASTVADVCDVLVREQLILSLSPEARMFVLEHETVSATDTAKLVDTFVRAQRTASVQPDASISCQLASSPLVAAVNKAWSKHTSSSNSSKSTPVSQPCFFCAGEAHPRSQCPAKDEDCGKCGKRGHNTRACRSAGQTTRVSQVPGRQQDSVNISDNSFFLGTVNAKASGWQVDIHLDGISVTFKVDTGAEVSVIPLAMYESLRHKPVLKQTQHCLVSASNESLDTLGYFSANLVYQSAVPVSTDLYVVRSLRHSLLSCSDSERLGLVKRLFETSEPSPTSKQFTKDSEPDTSPAELPDKCSVLTANIPDWVAHEFPSLFSDLGCLSDEYHIELTPEASPSRLYTPRNVPLPLRSKVEQELTRMEQLGVIQPVDGPTDWCQAMVVVPKPDGSVRICVDLKPLNQFIPRELHQQPTVDETLAQLDGATVFTKLDANSGFWQIPLSAESRRLTTFITPFGRFMFTKLPFGIASAPEVFQYRMAKILKGLPGTAGMIDDTVIGSRGNQDHDTKVRAVLTRFADAGMTLNPKKCQFSTTTFSFLGVQIKDGMITPDPKKMSALSNFPSPRNVQELRRFLGMVNQMGKFSPRIAELTQPLRALLSKTSSWIWDDPQQNAFDDIVVELSQSPALLPYDPTYETKLSADASSWGVGAVLFQRKTPSSGWQPVACASRSMTSAECNYAQIEKEALALTWSCDRFNHYLLGLAVFTMETDHKPLVPLFSTKLLHSLPARVLRFRLRLARYHFNIIHVPGKYLHSADALSRAPDQLQPSRDITELSADADTSASSVLEVLDVLPAHLSAVGDAQQTDQLSRTLSHYITTGWPNYSQLAPELKPFWSMRQELTLSSGLILRGQRLYVPPCLRDEILRTIHQGHQGETRCKLRAATSVWWPGLASEIKRLVATCPECSKYRVQPTEPLVSSPTPDRPWQVIGADLAQHGRHTYLILVDYYSRFPEVVTLTSTTSAKLVSVLHSIFARHGVPEVFRSDNGPQFVSADFQRFLQRLGIQHITSSPYYPQSNGEAERMVRTVKSMLSKNNTEAEFYDALLAYRTTPLAFCSTSPAELLMGRRLRSALPALSASLTHQMVDHPSFREADKTNKQKSARTYNIRHRARPTPPLQPGDLVTVTSGSSSQEKGTVVGRAEEPRSYHERTRAGTLRRNRRHLAK